MDKVAQYTLFVGDMFKVYSPQTNELELSVYIGNDKYVLMKDGNKVIEVEKEK